MSLPEKTKEPTSRYAHIMMLLAGFIQVAHAEVPFDPPGAHATSWLGNTYLDANGYKVVTEELADICVSPNGHLFSAGYAEAWGGGAEYNAVNRRTTPGCIQNTTSDPLLMIQYNAKPKSN
jgi:hypothetical protein